MKRIFLYAGLWLEILSASCRWLAIAKEPGARAKWRAFVTMSLIWTGYLPPPKNTARHVFAAHQRESIQECLKSFNPALLKKFYLRKKPDESYPVEEL